MCQPKSKGGKRCAVHQPGSRAAINTAVATVKAAGETATRQEAEVVFKELRKEGKDLPAPSEEIVREFAESQRFQAAFNPDLTEAQRARIQEQWREAARKPEEIDGATMHGWKYTALELLRRARTKVAAVFAAGALSVSMAACSSNGGDIEPTFTPTSTPTPSVASTYTPSEYGIDPNANIEFGISVSDESASDAYGEYQLVDVSEESPAYKLDNMEYNISVTDKYDQETLDAMQQASAEFVLKKMMDGPAAVDGSPAQFQKQSDETSKFITPAYREEYQNSLLSGDVGAVDGVSQLMKEPELEGIKPVYDANSARYSLVSIEQASEAITPNSGEGVVYYYHVTNRRPVEYADGVKGYIESDVYYGLTMVPTENKEQPFEITGWLNKGDHTAYRLDGTIIGESEVE